MSLMPGRRRTLDSTPDTTPGALVGNRGVSWVDQCVVRIRSCDARFAVASSVARVAGIIGAVLAQFLIQLVAQAAQFFSLAEKVLADEGARVEILQFQLGEFRAELCAQVGLRGLGEGFDLPEESRSRRSPEGPMPAQAWTTEPEAALFTTPLTIT
jgi:hypothetical protein